MPKENPVVRLRTKILRITCTEQSALDIVEPFVNLTAYILGIEGKMEMTASLKKQITDAKGKLATVMSDKLARTVEPESLSSIDVAVVADEGYFRINVIETHLGATTAVQWYKIILNGAAGLTFMDKVGNKATDKPHGNKGKVFPKERLDNMSAALKGKKATKGFAGKTHSQEASARIGKSRKGKPLSADIRAKISQAKKGKPLSEEHKAKMNEARKGKPLTEKEKAKLTALHLANVGRKRSLETRAKISKARQGMIASAETRAKISAACIGRVMSQETRAKISAAKLGKNHDGIIVTQYNTQGTKASRAKAKIEPVVKRLKQKEASNV